MCAPHSWASFTITLAGLSCADGVPVLTCKSSLDNALAPASAALLASFVADVLRLSNSFGSKYGNTLTGMKTSGTESTLTSVSLGQGRLATESSAMTEYSEPSVA